MTTDGLPEGWDWVTERGKCSAVQMFETLYALAQSNVAARNRQSPRESEQERFRVNEPQGGQRNFAVLDTWGHERRIVAFSAYGDPPTEILVRKNYQREETTYTLTLNDEGKCRLLIRGQELAPWQVMRRALEDLFF